MSKNISLNQILAKDLQLEQGEIPMSEAELLDWLANYVAYLIENRIEYLMSLMYRMDISEQKVSDALSPNHPEPANLAVAKLILNRQKQRIFTKEFYQQENVDIADDLKW